MTDIVLVSTVNPIFEETLVCGYIVTALGSRRKSWMGIGVSAAIRLLYHLYQGPMGIIGMAPLALAFAWWYAA